MSPDGALVLGFDTTAAHCAAALVLGEAVLARRVEPMDRGQAERLVPLLGEVLAEAGLGWSALDAIGVCTGPGNFTGVRLCVAAARGLSLARGIPAVGVSLFEALAAGRAGEVLVTLDGRRGLLMAQRFRDGAAVGPAGMVERAEATPGTLCLGHRAAEIAAEIGGLAGPEDVTAAPEVIARLTAGRLGTPQPRPAPVYLRPPDAAPSREPAPVILDA